MASLLLGVADGMPTARVQLPSSTKHDWQLPHSQARNSQLCRAEAADPVDPWLQDLEIRMSMFLLSFAVLQSV